MADVTYARTAHAYDELIVTRDQPAGNVAHAYAEVQVGREGIASRVAHAYLEALVVRPVAGGAPEFIYGLPTEGVCW